MNDDRKLLPNVAARRLGVTDQHVRRLVRQGKLDGERQGQRDLRIPESAVEAYRIEEELRRRGEYP
jgi:excisionase family DNA binding protein